MVWIACLAFVFGLRRFVLRLPPSGEATLAETLRAIASVAEGTALAGLWLAISRWARGGRFPGYPGEWLWLAAGTFTATSLLAPVFREIVRNVLGLDFTFVYANYLVEFIAFVVAAIRGERGRWQSWMVSRTIAGAVVLYVFFGFEVSSGPGPFARAAAMVAAAVVLALPLFSLIVLVVADLARRTAYPWSHWTGVGAYLLGFAALIVDAASSLATAYAAQAAPPLSDP